MLKVYLFSRPVSIVRCKPSSVAILFVVFHALYIQIMIVFASLSSFGLWFLGIPRVSVILFGDANSPLYSPDLCGRNLYLVIWLRPWYLTQIVEKILTALVCSFHIKILPPICTRLFSAKYSVERGKYCAKQDLYASAAKAEHSGRQPQLPSAHTRKRQSP